MQPSESYLLGLMALSVTGSTEILGNKIDLYSNTLNIGRVANLIDEPINTNVVIQGDITQTGNFDIDGSITVGGDFAESATGAGNNIFIGAIGDGGSAVAQSSDRKLKQNIVDLDSQLDNIKSLQPREFEWKSNKVKGKGLIAQELQEVYPSLVNKHNDNLYVNYTGMIPMLIKGMQEQQEMIEKLTAKINELEKKIDK